MFRIVSIAILLFGAVSAYANAPLTVHVIDVGQGDSIFVRSPEGKTMLIDAGDNDGRTAQYLDSIGVKKIDILVASHPHLDHIGGLPDIVKRYEIGQVVMPRVTEVTTVIYRQLLESIKAKGMRVTTGKAGLALDFGETVSVECLAPNGEQYKDINDYSVVLKLTYGETSFLFTGDATAVSEKEMLKFHKEKLKSTVLKVGHHGSGGSSSAAFLKEVAPDIAVFCVGNNNKFGHPTQAVLGRMEHCGQFRTDRQGTVIFTSNGAALAALGPPVNGSCPKLTAVNKALCLPPTMTLVEAQRHSQIASDLVYVTKTGTKYHRNGCRAAKDPIPMSRMEASGQYGPCAICKP